MRLPEANGSWVLCLTERNSRVYWPGRTITSDVLIWIGGWARCPPSLLGSVVLRQGTTQKRVDQRSPTLVIPVAPLQKSVTEAGTRVNAY